MMNDTQRSRTILRVPPATPAHRALAALQCMRESIYRDARETWGEPLLGPRDASMVEQLDQLIDEMQREVLA